MTYYYETTHQSIIDFTSVDWKPLRDFQTLNKIKKKTETSDE